MTPDITARTALFAPMQTISRQTTLPFFRNPMAIDNKQQGSGGFDPVTQADRGCEQALRALIERQFPGDGILGEEYGSVRLDSPFVWVIDPVDGTRAFVSGVPLWGTLVGLLHHGRPVAGLAFQPFIGEAFSAQDNIATWSRDQDSQVLNTRPCARLSTATLMTTTPHLFDPIERAAYDVLEGQARNIRYGTDWYAYALLAAGTVDIVVESGLSLYDILPLVALIEAGGGIVTDWTGKALSDVHSPFCGQVLALGDRALLPAVAQLLAPASRA